MTASVFEYFEALGEGAAGVVYRAKDQKGREVAVKLLRESAAKDQDLVRRFRREVDIATAMEHENLVNAFEGGRTAAGRLYLSSEFVSGANAARVLEGTRPLPEAAALAVARDILRALGFLCSQKFVHRDVKPENVLIRSDGIAKLSDFGLARSATAGGARLTATGEVLGTPYYMAPEQIKAAKDIDIRADIYSVGCMLYEWLSGKRPYDGAGVIDILSGHVKGAIPDLAAARPDAQPETVALLKQFMAKNRDDRPADPAAAEKLVTAALLKCGAGDGRDAVRAAVAKATGAAAPKAPAAAMTLSSGDATAAQGARSPRFKLKLTAQKSALTLFIFSGIRLQLGRDGIDKSANDVCLRVKGPNADAGSRKINSAHVRIELDPAKAALVKDLETQNGTKVGGMKLAPKAPFAVRSTARIDIAGALELELRIVPSETAGHAPAAAVLTRPANGSDQAYALVREKLLLNENNGVPVAGAHTGTLLVPTESGFTLNNQPVVPGAVVEASGLKIEVSEIRPEDMK